VQLGADVVTESRTKAGILETGGIQFQSSVDSDAAVTPRALLVNTSGITYFWGNIGGNLALRTLETDNGAAADFALITKKPPTFAGERTEFGSSTGVADISVRDVAAALLAI
jgi:hypothetical protein